MLMKSDAEEAVEVWCQSCRFFKFLTTAHLSSFQTHLQFDLLQMAQTVALRCRGKHYSTEKLEYTTHKYAWWISFPVLREDT